MGLIASIKEIFSFFFKQGIKSKKAKVFFVLSMIPVVILLIAKIIELTNPDSFISASQIFNRVMVVIYIQLMIPILALFFGSMIINEEVENKTLIYLTTAPIPRPGILIGKFLAYVLLSAIIINLGLLFAFLVVNMDNLMEFAYIKSFFNFLGSGLLALLAYSGFFALASAVIKRSMIFGLLFIFGWESVVQYLPGTTQKFTIMHYVKSILPATSENVKFLVFRLQPSGNVESIVILLLITIVAMGVASYAFLNKEYILTDTD